MKTITINIDGKEIEATISEQDAAELTISEQDAKELTAEKPWPQVGDRYWSVASDVGLNYQTYEEDYVDQQLAEMGNMFCTKEEAKAEVRARKLIVAVNKRRKELNGDWVPVFSELSQFKYMITFRHGIQKFEVATVATTNTATPFGYFKNKDDLKTVIGEFKDDLTWYFTEYANS